MPEGTEHFPDPAFLERARPRAEEALPAVVHAYTHQCLRAVLGAGLREEEAEEIVQETFVAFVDSADRFEGRSHLRTWLFGILYNKISEARRRYRRDASHAPSDDVVEARFAAGGRRGRPARPVRPHLHG